jgi:enamine deaminase RidA (YjgF/YER057c/UK114 family)
MSERVKISTGSPWEPIIGYSRAIRIGNRVEVSGTTAMQNGQVVGPDSPYEQTVHILKTIEKALQDAGSSLSDVVRTRIYLTDISRWEEVGRAHGEFFEEIRPVTTIVEVSALISKELLVEIEAEAIISE